MKSLALLFSIIIFFQFSFANPIGIKNNLIEADNIQFETLNKLDLSDYGLTEIPENISSFKSLKKLNLGNNQLTSLAHIKHLTSLEEIILDGNKALKYEEIQELFTALKSLKRISFKEAELLFIPSKLFDLTQLESLDLSNNQIELIPSEIGRLKHLNSLNLENNSINYTGNGLQKLRSLEYLNLTNNPLKSSESILLQLGVLKQLSILEIDNLDLSPSLSKSVKISSVEVLTLNECDNFHRNNLLVLFPNLKTLQLNGSISESGLEFYINDLSSEKLKSLSIHNNSIAYLPDNLYEIKTLESLKIEGNSIEKLSPRLSRSNQLKSFTLINAVDIDIKIAMNQIASINNLTDLVLINCNITDLPSSISRLKKLNYLNLNYNEIDKLANSFKYLKKLEKAELRGSKLSNENIDKLKTDMPQCTFILNESRKKLLNPPLPDKDVSFDQFIVPAAIGSAIQTASGSEIIIPKNAFLTKNGDVVTNQVRVEYRELADPIDMVFSGVPMTTTVDGEERYFSSAGMMEFRAFQNNEELFPNPKKPVTINYNSAFEGDNYNLYYLDSTSNEWEEIGKDNIVKSNDRRNIPRNRSIPFFDTPAPNYPVFPFTTEHISLKILKGASNKDAIVAVSTYRAKLFSRRDTNNKVYSELKYLNRVKWKIDHKDDLNEYKKELKKLSKLISTSNRQNMLNSRMRNFEDVKLNTDLNLVDNFRLEPNPKEDNFHMVFSMASETIRIPVVPYKLPKKAAAAQRKVKQIYTKYYKYLKHRNNDWAIIENKYDESINQYEKQVAKYEIEYKLYKEDKEEYQRIARENIKTYQANENNIIRSFQLDNFGMFNCDVIQRMEKPKKILAKLLDEEGNGITIEKIYVLDKDLNGLAGYDKKSSARYDSKHTISLIAILPNNKVGVINSKAFNPKSISSTTSKASMKIFDMKSTSILELRQNASFF